MALTERGERIRLSLEQHMQSILSDEIAKIRDPESKPSIEKRTKLEARFASLEGLFSNAKLARRVDIATHISKGIHPDAQSWNVNVGEIFRHNDYVGTHTEVQRLRRDATNDAVVNQKVLDLYLIVHAMIDEKPFLQLLVENDADALAILHSDSNQTAVVTEDLLHLAKARWEKKLDSCIKQIYWFTGNDPHDDTHYHIIAPLLPTSLCHAFLAKLNEDRFGENTKMAREARSKKQWHDAVMREYPNLGVVRMGGTKPQNISQLNSERRGENLLLPSLPPSWETSNFSEWFGRSNSFLRVLQFHSEVKDIFSSWFAFLATKPEANIHTRNRVKRSVEDLVDYVLQATARARTLPSGWSQDSRCRLRLEHRQWLDPTAYDNIKDDRWMTICEDFSRWINMRAQKGSGLPFGDAEYATWFGIAKAILRDYQPERHSR